MENHNYELQDNTTSSKRPMLRLAAKSKDRKTQDYTLTLENKTQSETNEGGAGKRDKDRKLTQERP